MTLLVSEKLKVYDAALNFVVLAEQLVAKTPRGHAASRKKARAN